MEAYSKRVLSYLLTNSECPNSALALYALKANSEGASQMIEYGLALDGRQESLLHFRKRCKRATRGAKGVKDKATGINYGATATYRESIDSEAVSRPDQKDLNK